MGKQCHLCGWDYKYCKCKGGPVDFYPVKPSTDADRIDTLTAERDELLKHNRGMLENGGYDHMAMQIKDERSEAAKHRNATTLLVNERKSLTADLAAMTADRDRLRDTMQQVQLEMLAEDGEVPDTDDDWTMLHGWISQFDTALAARDQQAGAKGGE